MKDGAGDHSRSSLCVTHRLTVAAHFALGWMANSTRFNQIELFWFFETVFFRETANHLVCFRSFNYGERAKSRLRHAEDSIPLPLADFIGRCLF